MKWKAKLSTAENAREELPALAAQFFDAGRDAVKHKRSPRELHRFRVRTKMFRYALEIFAPVYGPELEERVKLLKHLQGMLGKISDAYTILEMLQDHPALRKQLDREGKQYIQEFREYWMDTFDAPHELTVWRELLSEPKEPPEQPA